MTFQFLFRLTEHVHAAIHLSNNKKTTFKTTINSLTFASQNWYPKKKEIAFVNPYLGVSMLMDCVYILCVFDVGIGKYTYMQTLSKRSITYQLYWCVCASLLIFHEIHLAKQISPQFHSVYPNCLMWNKKINTSFSELKNFNHFFSFSFWKITNYFL